MEHSFLVISVVPEREVNGQRYANIPVTWFTWRGAPKTGWPDALFAKEEAEQVKSYVLAIFGWQSALQNPMRTARVANSDTSQPAVQSAIHSLFCESIWVEHETDVEPPMELVGRMELGGAEMIDSAVDTPL